MKRSKKVSIIAACLFLTVLISASLYAYDRIGDMLSTTNLKQLLKDESQDKLSTFSTPKAPENDPNITSSQGSSQQTDVVAADINHSDASQAVIDGVNSTQTNTKLEKPVSSSNLTPAENPALPNKIASTLEKEAGRPIDTSDILKAGYILMGKLNNDEINFLFGFSDKKYTTEELKKAREVLLSKLSAQDIETLQALAGKYGKYLYILDPSVPLK